MEKMYQDYRDIVEFRMIYITEAHAIDSKWPMGIAEEKNIKQHTNFGERCATAEMLVSDKSLTIPTLIDNMDNAANQAYRAHPDRVFLIRSDGRLAVAAERGPWGFGPAVENVQTWLAEFRESGTEPDLPADAVEAAKKREADKENTDDSSTKKDSR